MGIRVSVISQIFPNELPMNCLIRHRRCAVLFVTVLVAVIGVAIRFGLSQKLSQTTQPFGRLTAVAVLPHDRAAYTQGLLFDDGVFYESTGMYGESTLRKVEVETGKVVKMVPLPQQYFGEGLALYDKKLYLLTWQNGLCFVFDKDTFHHLNTFRYSGEGWGLTSNGTHLILSDGTAKLRFYDPENFRLVKTVTVFDGSSPKQGRLVTKLNELEWIHGEIWSNIWQSPRIARIDPETGKVLGWIDCTEYIPKEFLAEHHRRELADNVLNGIAFDPKTNHLYLTGKRWNVVHQFRLENPVFSHLLVP